MTLDYLVTSFIVILLPGTGVLYTLSIALNSGRRAAMFAAFGCTLGILPHMIVSIAGLATVFQASPVLFEIVRYGGVVYLLFMAWSVLRDTGSLTVEDEATSEPARKIIVRAILLNVLNPKLSVFFLSFLPQFVPADAPSPTLAMLWLALGFMVLTFVVFLMYGIFVSAARRGVLARPSVTAWLRIGFAGAFGLMGLRLLLSPR